MTRAMKSPGARFGNDQNGVALIEFAIVLPFLVLLFLGGFQLMDAISAYRKVGGTVHTLADLTTQNTTMTAADADAILKASREVMAPYSPENAVLRISQIHIEPGGQAVVSWSKALNGAPYATGAVVTVPTAMAVADTYYIFSEINYRYVPGMASSLIGTIPLTQTIYMSPRNSQFIAPQQGPLS